MSRQFKPNRKFTFFILISIFFAVIFTISHHKALSGSGDYDTYYAAFRDALRGQDFYRRDTNLGPYLYPPSFASAFSFLGFLPYRVSHVAWFLLNSAAFISAVFVLRRLCPTQKIWPMVVFFGLVSFADNVAMSQVTPIMLWCLAMGYALWREKKPMLAGALFAFAACLKVTPAIVLLYFVLKKQWRVVLGWSLGAALYLVLVPGIFFGISRLSCLYGEWSQTILHGYRDTSAAAEGGTEERAKFQNLLNASNQALPAVFYRLFYRDLEKKANDERMPIYAAQRYQIYWPLKLGEGGVRFIIGAVMFSIVLLTVIAIVFGRPSSTTALGLFSLTTLLMLLIAPNVRSHAMLVAMFSYFFLWGDPRKIQGVVLSLLLFALQGVPLFEAHGSGFWAMAVLWGMVLVETYKESKENPEYRGALH